MDIIHVCPAHVTTGGTESIHNLVHTFNQVDGVNAKIWYWQIRGGDPQPDEYKRYGCEYITELPHDYHGVLIMPEIWANSVLDYDCIRAINWLGIDAYAGHTSKDRRGMFLLDDNIIHLPQSAYADDFLRKLGAKHIFRNVDVLNDDFFKTYEEKPRYDTVLYNPAKATPFTYKLIDEAMNQGIRFEPIQGLTRTELINKLRQTKLYIDFGDFPGRERIPREAVMCGCCIIIGAVGSGRFYDDFTLYDRYAFDRKEAHIFAIVREIKRVLAEYDEAQKDFEMFRAIIRADRELLIRQCKDIVYEIQHHYPGV